MHPEEFGRVGRRLVADHLIGGNFGNMSMRDGDAFLITRTGAYLDEPGDLVRVPLEGPVPPAASNEYRVHRDIYRKTPFRAVVHAHPAFSVALSFDRDRIVPIDCEGTTLCPVIPIVAGAPGTGELAAAVASGIAETHLVIARGHGTFAAGETLAEAYLYTSLCEHACRVLAIREGARDERSEFNRKKSPYPE